jgi:hypothetical protein
MKHSAISFMDLKIKKLQSQIDKMKKRLVYFYILGLLTSLFIIILVNI